MTKIYTEFNKICSNFPPCVFTKYSKTFKSIVSLYSTSNEMKVTKGDIIGIAGNHWDGYSKGVNKRTTQNGLYPSYKAEDVVELGSCPTYDEVKL